MSARFLLTPSSGRRAEGRRSPPARSPCCTLATLPSPSCAEGRPGLCYTVSEGPIEVGLQTGYCADTGGGWGEILVAHPSQLHPVPASLSDEAAVLIEPFACCVHAALRAGASKDDIVVVS